MIVYDTDGGTPRPCSAFADGEDRPVGVMGTKSRAFAEKNKIVSDIGSNVIDRRSSGLLCGEAVLVITNGGMVEHAKRRIEEYHAGERYEDRGLRSSAEVWTGKLDPGSSPANAGKRVEGTQPPSSGIGDGGAREWVRSN